MPHKSRIATASAVSGSAKQLIQDNILSNATNGSRANPCNEDFVRDFPPCPTDTAAVPAQTYQEHRIIGKAEVLTQSPAVSVSMSSPITSRNGVPLQGAAATSTIYASASGGGLDMSSAMAFASPKVKEMVIKKRAAQDDDGEESPLMKSVRGERERKKKRWVRTLLQFASRKASITVTLERNLGGQAIKCNPPPSPPLPLSLVFLYFFLSIHSI